MEGPGTHTISFQDLQAPGPVQVIMKFISNEPNENEYLCEATDICDDKIQNKKRTIRKKQPKHTLQIKRQIVSVDYSNK